MNIDLKETGAEKYISLVKSKIHGERKLAYVTTLGCQQNEADSEKLRWMAVEMGYTVTDKPEGADLILVNTCAIREHAEMKALSLIGRFKALKAENSELVIGVCGCMAAEPHVVNKIKSSFRHVSFTLEPAMIWRFPELLYNALMDGERRFIFGLDDGNAVEGLGKVRASDRCAWVSVMYGCNNFCSYCIVPYVRGRERSRESAEIIEECRELIEKGYREITLVGQNVNSYRSDMTFAELISAIASIPGDFILRFMTSHPKDVSDELILAMKTHRDKIAPAFHLPMQSGSDRILKAMNRTYDTKKYLETVKKLREAVPDIAISTDIIVGFPGETLSDFEDTLRMMREVRFDMIYAFIYSKREGTRAATFDCQIPEDEKSRRIGILLELEKELSLERNLPYVGKICRVFVDSRAKRGAECEYSGRTASNKVVHFKSERDVTGEFVNVKILSAGTVILDAEMI